MDEEIFKSTMSAIEEKLGSETTATIADELGKLHTAQDQALSKQAETKQIITELESKNEKLVAANGNLLRQIPARHEAETLFADKPPEKPPFDPRSAFEHGKLKF